jgi:hypothetical protein
VARVWQGAPEAQRAPRPEAIAARHRRRQPRQLVLARAACDRAEPLRALYTFLKHCCECIGECPCLDLFRKQGRDLHKRRAA